MDTVEVLTLLSNLLIFSVISSPQVNELLSLLAVMV